jgi:hypothetical protein
MQNKKKYSWVNIKAYLQGHIRMWLFYSPKFSWLIPLYIYEQINYRLFVMDKECYNNGECKECGCATPALQMADKACKGKCYPEILDETDWHIYKRENNIDFRYWSKNKPRDFELRISHKPFIK